MAYIDRPLDNSIGTSMTLREGCDLINDNFEVLAADKLKLDGIESGAQVNTITSVAGQTGDIVLTKSDVGLNNVDNIQQAPITRTITAGTGLSGGGDLTVDRTLSVSYGAAAGTAAQGNDTRITGAAQKSANLSDLTNAATARTNLGLGTAATRNIGTASDQIPLNSALSSYLLKNAANLNSCIALGTTQSVLGDVDNSIELATTTEVGSGTSHNHTGARLVAFGMTSWGTAKLGVQLSTEWKQYGSVREIHHTGNGATNAEALTGTNTEKWMSPANVKHVIENSSIGIAVQADKLTTPRTINGTAFDGTGNITTSNWGTGRTLTIGNTGKSVNGSANISWSLSEIGAPSTAGAGASGNWGINITGSAATATKLATARTIGGVSFDGTANINLPGVNIAGNQNTSGLASPLTSYPVGATYIQFPGRSSPSALFGGTWSQLFNTEGVFFRTEGGNASAFGSGIQTDMITSHSHVISFRENRLNSNSGGADNSTLFSPNATGTTELFGGVETRPVNRTIRVWVRTA